MTLFQAALTAIELAVYGMATIILGHAFTVYFSLQEFVACYLCAFGCGCVASAWVIRIACLIRIIYKADE